MPEEKPTSPRTLALKPGSLWPKVKARTNSALQGGALHSIATESEFVEQNGIRFLVRRSSNIARKDEAKKQQDRNTTSSGKEVNPFLPYEKDLFVADISDTHLCLLNKFNVVEDHLLIVTREFEEQESLLTLSDFEAMWAVLAEIDGLAFYNGGKLAGASQRHKHLQVVPLPIAPSGPPIPILPALATASFQGMIGTIPAFQFSHTFAKLKTSEKANPLATARSTLECYHTLLDTVGLSSSHTQQVGAYNLLVTREWMLIIARSQESFDSISINSLGFAGTFFVRNDQQMQLLKDYGPLTILQNVAQPVRKNSNE
ncbi:MAG: ATP adenylyltransferase family protein [Actinomycetota bacterium]